MEKKEMIKKLMEKVNVLEDIKGFDEEFYDELAFNTNNYYDSGNYFSTNINYLYGYK